VFLGRLILPQKVLATQIDQAFTHLKALVTEQKNRIVSEQPPTHLTTLEGSVWGTSPKTAQKKTTYILTQHTTGTHIQSHTALSPAYLSLTLAGYVACGVLMVVCIWMGLNLDGAGAFVGLGWALAVFLAIALVAETIILLWIHAHLQASTEEILNALY
jgi:hypothetical protein